MTHIYSDSKCQALTHFGLQSPRDGGAHVETPGPEPLLKGFSLFLKMTHQKTWFTQACLAYSWQSQTEFKWPHLQYVSGYHFTHKHIQKFNTNIQKNKRPLLRSFHQPQQYPSTLLSYNSRFQRISRMLILCISGKNSLQPRPQWCARMRSHGINTVILPRALIVHWDVVCWEITGISAICKGPVTPGPRQPQNPVFSCVLQLSTISESSKNRMFLSCE